MFAISSVRDVIDGTPMKNECLTRQAASSTSKRLFMKGNMDGVSLVNGWSELLADAEMMMLQSEFDGLFQVLDQESRGR